MNNVLLMNFTIYDMLISSYKKNNKKLNKFEEKDFSDCLTFIYLKLKK